MHKLLSWILVSRAGPDFPRFLEGGGWVPEGLLRGLPEGPAEGLPEGPLEGPVEGPGEGLPGGASRKACRRASWEGPLEGLWEGSLGRPRRRAEAVGGHSLVYP